MTTFVVTPGKEPSPVYHRAGSSTEHYLTRWGQYRGMKGRSVLQGTETNSQEFIPNSNGFMNAVIAAYNSHHNLVIRPDDVWIAIMIQFSFFVNGNAESLRSKFVAHEGKKTLTVYTDGTLKTLDYGDLSNQMAKLMREHITDPVVCDWVAPNFSTTTDNDRIVGSVVLMASMKQYFDYWMSCGCGIPSVTLLGTLQDWKDIQQRVLKIAEYGENCEKWSRMLSSILKEFVAVVEDPVNVNLQFWQRICHYHPTGSGPTYVSGWSSAFAVFSDKVRWCGDEFTVKTRYGDIIDSLEYPVISSIPHGYATIDITVDDYGTQHNCAMFVGHTGYDIVETCGVAPKLCWAIVLKGDSDEKKDEEC
ncbi:hypothetical protein BDR26DRAFT_849125 [Obelidium mucronatum]|nr:hypothetical protein BDR26DRAFT_849125 [Obelidium mucronatum]